MSTKVNLFEKIIFNNRVPILIAFLAATVFFFIQATGVTLDTSLKKMVPLKHEYIQNLFKHKDELSLGNDIRIAVEHTEGDIFNKEYLQVLKDITDEVFYLPNVDKSKVQSLWTPNVRWVEVTEEGFKGGEVIPPTYDGSEESIEQLQNNVLRSGQIGRLVADNFKSAIVYVPLLDLDVSKGEKLDYQAFSHMLEEKVREKYQSDKIKIHIIGFAKKVGDLIDGARGVAMFFLIAIGITFVMLLLDAKCFRSATTVVVCSLIAVIWQLGMLSLLHDLLASFRQTEAWPDFVKNFPSFEAIQFGIDPYSMLVPFLVFAIGVSHGVQIINEMAVNAAKQNDPLTSAKKTFHALYIPGIVALVSDAIGFVTLWFIEVGVIQELAIAASMGVATIILTNLILVPVVLSFTGVSNRAIASVLKKREKPPMIWRKLSGFAHPSIAAISILVGVILAAVGWYYSQGLKIGDLDAGAPELRKNSRYNLDDRFISQNYSVSADVLVVMVETPKEGCIRYPALHAMDRFMWHMENIEGVQSTVSLVTVSKLVTTGFNEGNLKWAALSKVQDIINGSLRTVPEGLMNLKCSLAPVIIFLEDHKAETLERAVEAVEEFAAENDNPNVAKFVLASGNAGVEAATNQTIEASQDKMLYLVYGVVCFLVLITFRTWRAVVCIVVPLALTSLLCQALMAVLGIGVKVATLPVIALGVGIGVDYGIYIYSRLQGFIAEGMPLQKAYFETLRVTGKAVSFTGLTLAIGVGTWIFSDIKFQADMGLLLTFMFLWNMVGAIWLLPAFADFLLTKQPKKKGANQ
ncbi:MAG: MMPL family transporter [Ketobacteraceae bacterium]|nr:MMPL family transporter [Ketobacteraceae bacterium]